MADLTPQEFLKSLANIPIELQSWCNDDAPTIAGKTAVDVYTKNFQLEGFRNNGLQPWAEVKRRKSPKTKGAARTRKILTGETGNLGRGFDYNPSKAQVLIYNDARSAKGFPYAEVHNQGVSDAGRRRNVVIPKRQLLGQSAELDRLVIMEINRKLKSLRK